MIRVTVELVSAIDPSRDRVLGVAHIANTGAPGENVYEVKLSKWAPKTSQTWKKGRLALADEELGADVLAERVVGFDRIKRGAWDLLFLALLNTVGKRNL